MGAGASVPETEEEALAQGYTQKQIDEYKVLIVKLARENALKALELQKQSQKKQTPTKKPPRPEAKAAADPAEAKECK